MSDPFPFPGYRMLTVGPAGLVDRCKWSATKLPPELKTAGVMSINRWVNTNVAYLPEDQRLDRWQDPDVTLELGEGDCEDYAILKYAALRDNGWDPDDMAVICGVAVLLPIDGGPAQRLAHAMLYVGESNTVVDNRSNLIHSAHYHTGHFSPFSAVNELSAWVYLPEPKAVLEEEDEGE